MAITDYQKSLEERQAYLLLNVYPQPARSWEKDCAWLFLGCAIWYVYPFDFKGKGRPAMDLNLYKQVAKTLVDETHGREVLNWARTWLISVKMDRALATRLARTTIILCKM
ncbi:Fungal specific transcription factor domain [Ceratobasidium sp. AG-Ba]|nr:Fungal specific transcription factor domain [Ceratobasidium sp. AG-Ba]